MMVVKVAVAAGLFLVSAVAQGPACPNCDLDSPTNYTCVSGAFTSPLTWTTITANVHVDLCVGVQTGLVSCDNKDVGNPRNAFNLSTSDSNCGACGNACAAPTPSCVNGRCGCKIGQVGLNTTVRCDPIVNQLLPCPAGLANCNAIGDNGLDTVDCETDVTSNTLNCGACGFKCGPGHTCVNGKCMCGSNVGKCPWPRQICSGGECVECNDLGTPQQCMKLSILQDHKYCNSTQGTCITCPLGMGDCTPLNTTNSPDTGAPSDCETNFNNSFGHTPKCGTCRASCSGHAKMSCCAGVCKCGTFVDAALNPTLDECAAAVSCSTTEYCDGVLGKCLPLLPGNIDCTGTAKDQYSNDNYLGGGISNYFTSRVCASCDLSIASKNVINNTCQAANNDACGAAGTKCKDGQDCLNGQCNCTLNTLFFLSWTPFLDNDPDRDFKFLPGAKPAQGCSQLITDIAYGFFDREMQTLNRFLNCIYLSQGLNITSITPADFKNATFRATVCPGGSGQCPTSFCDALAQNFTGSDRSSLCGSVDSASAAVKSCAQNFIVVGTPGGDLTCSNEMASLYAATPTTSLNSLDIYNFLGCDKPRDDMKIFLPNAPSRPKIPMYRVEQAIRLLGGGVAQNRSWMIAVIAAVVFCYTL